MQTAEKLESMGLLPSDEEVRDFQARGWYMSRPIFSEDTLQELIDASDRYYEGHRDRPLAEWPPRAARWTKEKGDVHRINNYVHLEDDTFRRILQSEIIGEIAARLLRVSEIRIWNTALIYKPAKGDFQADGIFRPTVPWHYDKDYWCTCSSDNMITAFIPFSACDENMGTLQIAEGSHLWADPDTKDSKTEHYGNRSIEELEEMLIETARHNGTELKKVPMIYDTGCVSFHHSKVYHGSLPNYSTKPRRSVALHLQSGENRYREFRNSKGEVVSYTNDYIVHKNAAGDPDYTDPAVCPVLYKS